MKNWIVKTFIVWISYVSLVGASPAVIPSAPSLSAKSYLLMDYKSGNILVSQKADKRVDPASLTKMMTSYVAAAALEENTISYDDMVVVSKNAWAKNFPGSSVMFIEVGKQVSVRDLLKGIIIQSGNDASVAIAEHIAGSESSFADLMNHHAKRLGMNSTHFTNSTGLPHPQHYTTAHDMAILAQALIRDYPESYQIYSVKEFTYADIKQYNRNSLLWDPSLEIDGVKTGHTESAGYCLVTSGVENGTRLISVVMGADSKDSRASQSKQLLTYGFRYFESISPLEGGKSLHSERVYMGEQTLVSLGVLTDKHITIPRGQAGNLKASFIINNRLIAPINKGQSVGKVHLKLGADVVAEYPLVTLNTVPEGSLWSQFSDWVSLKFDEMFE
ncbi:MAG: D-alanyl-D-alanine carboxypeptidase [Kangiellaceae bacterium]|jgi:D-alanyl-D-alanine carboxypeptidase (penicillin-binding protein 5/6)|nr:D-alanyl-D-alanine carboxypeptidase [Kangiellaceae bacterium]|tara:strand:+ start:1948 stop:3111 length:1164 start_codon:yes stop_codon:yes gene_type:complete